MAGLAIRRKQDEVAVIDLRRFGLGVIEVMQIGNWKLLFTADSRIPIHRREVFDEILARELGAEGEFDIGGEG